MLDTGRIYMGLSHPALAQVAPELVEYREFAKQAAVSLDKAMNETKCRSCKSRMKAEFVVWERKFVANLLSVLEKNPALKNVFINVLVPRGES